MASLFFTLLCYFGDYNLKATNFRYILALFSFLALYQCCVWNTWGPVVNSVQVGSLEEDQFLEYYYNQYWSIFGMVISHIDWSTLGYDLGWSEWCHNVFSRLCMAGTQPQCLCSPIGAPSPSWPSWSQFFIFRYYEIISLTWLLHGNPRTSTCVQLCCSPLVWWLLPPRSAAPSSSFLVSLTGKSNCSDIQLGWAWRLLI